MLGAFLLTLPFAAAGALSPMMLTEQTVLLATADGRRCATRYALGAFLTLFIFTGLATLLGRAISLPTEPSLSATLDIVFGAGLLCLAAAVHYVKRRRPDASRGKQRDSRMRSMSPRQAFGFGVFSMATNVTTLAVILPAAKIIAASGIGLPERVPLEISIALIASTPAWLPVALAKIAPGPTRRGLDWIGNLIANHGRDLVVAALAALGLFLVIRGIFEAASL